MSSDQLELLQDYTACDVSDALLKLETVEDGHRKFAGFLDGLQPYAPYHPTHTSQQSRPKIIAPASTVQFQPKAPCNGEDASPKAISSNIDPRSHWADSAQPDTVVVIQQPEGQRCAVLGGILARRLEVRGAKAVIVSGKVRDLGEIGKMKTPIWARSTSTVGTSAEANPYAIQVPIRVGGVDIQPGDIMFCDPVEGVVVIPQDLLNDVLRLLPALVEADDNVMTDVSAGMTVQEAFAKHRKITSTKT